MAKFLFVDFKPNIPKVNPAIALNIEKKNKMKKVFPLNIGTIGKITTDNATKPKGIILINPRIKEAIAFLF